MLLAIIPARGGSKGLPGKNIRPLAGLPLIGWSIRQAQQCPEVDRVLVSTDSEEIADIAQQLGAEVPALRPAHLSGDASTDLEVFKYELDAWALRGEPELEFVLQLRPTSPVRPVAHISAAIAQMRTNPEADSLRMITEAPATPYKMWTMPADSPTDPYMHPLLQLSGIAEPYNQPRQYLPKVYWQIGTLDIIRPRVITEQGTMSGKNILPYLLPQELAIDIDDIASFDRAEEAMHLAGMI